MKEVFNQVCLVTGASTGLGREIAKLLSEKGYKTYVTARQRDYLLGLKKECLSFDINQGCSGYIYGLAICSSLIQSGLAKSGICSTTWEE